MQLFAQHNRFALVLLRARGDGGWYRTYHAFGRDAWVPKELT